MVSQAFSSTLTIIFSNLSSEFKKNSFLDNIKIALEAVIKNKVVPYSAYSLNLFPARGHILITLQVVNKIREAPLGLAANAKRIPGQ